MENQELFIKTEEEFYQEFGIRLQLNRTLDDLNQSDLANALSTTKNRISKAENAQARLSLYELYLLYRLYSWEPLELLQLNDYPEGNTLSAEETDIDERIQKALDRLDREKKEKILPVLELIGE